MHTQIGEHIQAVLFDHDDTLVGTIESKWAQHKYIARTHYSKQLTDAEIAQHWGKPLHELVCLLYDTDDTAQAMEHTVTYHKNFPKTLFEGTLPTLKQLKAAGKMIGIITATTRLSFEHDLDLHHIPRELLDYTQTSEDTTTHKPDPHVFDPALDWLAQHNIPPEEVIYVGDGLHDMHAALGAGFTFLGVESGLVTHEAFSAVGAHSVPGIAHLVEQPA